MNVIFCDKCLLETKHRHMHSAPYGLEGAHMAGSERYECMRCGHEIYAKKGKEKGLKFILD